jgi:hypothetical protein
MTEGTTQQRNWRYVRLSNGDGVIADVWDVDPETMVMKHPFQVVFDRSRGGIDMIMVPWIPTSSTDDQEVIVSRRHVVYTTSIVVDLLNKIEEYAAKLYSGIIAREVKDLNTQEILDDEMEEVLEQLNTVLDPSPKKPN